LISSTTGCICSEEHELPLDVLVRLAGNRRNVLGLRDAVVAVAAGADFRLGLASGNIGGVGGEKAEREERNRANCVRDERPAHDGNSDLRDSSFWSATKSRAMMRNCASENP
jgi:hypothetical protein